MSSTLTPKEVIDIIVEKTDKSRDDIEQMIQDTIESMDNMINEEGAAYVVANSLGVTVNTTRSLDTITIEDLVAGQSNITITGRISKIYQTRVFERKDGTKGKVRNIEIIDNTGSTRVALWDKRADIIEEKDITVGQIVRISGASSKMGYNTDNIELSVGTQGLVDPINDADESKYPEVKHAPFVELNQLVDKENNKEISVKGKIIDRQGIVEFERNKEADKESDTGRVTSLTIADNHGKVRVTFWDDLTEKAQKFDVGNVVQITDLRVGENKYGSKELTFNSYSSIEEIEDPTLSEIESSSGGKVDSLSDIDDGMKNITVVGQVTSTDEIRTFERDGQTNQVSNIIIRDSSQSMKVAMWGPKANLSQELEHGRIIRISNASARLNDFSGEVELNINRSSTVEDITEDVDEEEFAGETEFIQLDQIDETRRGVSIKVQISRIYDTREVNVGDDTSEVLNAEVFDGAGNKARIAAWNENIPKISDLVEGDAYEFHNVRVKPSDGEYPPEITVYNNSEILGTELDDVIRIIQSADKYQNNPMVYQKRTLDSLTENAQVEVEGTIVKAYKPAIYNACSQCARKVEMDEGIEDKGTCPVHSEVQVQPRIILTLALDDGVDTADIKLFDKTAERLLDMSAEEAQDLILRLSDEMAPITQADLEMKDVVVKGKVDHNDYKDQLQINVDEISFVDHGQQTDEILDRWDY